VRSPKLPQPQTIPTRTKSPKRTSSLNQGARGAQPQTPPTADHTHEDEVPQVYLQFQSGGKGGAAPKPHGARGRSPRSNPPPHRGGGRGRGQRGSGAKRETQTGNCQKKRSRPQKPKPESESKKRTYTKYPKGEDKKEKKQQKSQSEKKVKKGVDKKKKLWYNNKVVRRGHQEKTSKHGEKTAI